MACNRNLALRSQNTEMRRSKGQSHFPVGGIAANLFFFGGGSLMASATVPLDRALLSFYRVSIVTIPLSVTVWPQFAMEILIGGSDPTPIPQISLGDPGTVLLGTTRVYLPNGISFRPTALARCMSVTDVQTYRRTTLRDHLSD